MINLLQGLKVLTVKMYDLVLSFDKIYDNCFDHKTVDQHSVSYLVLCCDSVNGI